MTCCALVAAGNLTAQGILDVLDGETLYSGGFLATLGFELDRGDQLRQGRDRIADPDAGHERRLTGTLALQYGLRHDLQLGIALAFADHERRSLAGDADADGLGDVHLLGKWRFLRLDGPARATNFALITELSLPTGEDDATTNGIRLEPELQPGSGGVDPALGVGITHEPGRWRFNAALLHQWRTDSDGDDHRLGNGLVAELAAGNRFWLEPYPGPFMRADLAVRWYDEDHARMGSPLADSGGERATVAVNWAFRPRPSVDCQVGVETPFWQDVGGTQLGHDWSVDLTFGYRF
ncbi:MAG: transporter [Planctomycetes bacterium]|nr:transporter [Planctomycetota bacterium]